MTNPVQQVGAPRAETVHAVWTEQLTKLYGTGTTAVRAVSDVSLGFESGRTEWMHELASKCSASALASSTFLLSCREESSSG